MTRESALRCAFSAITMASNRETRQKAPAALLHIASLPEPPLRLLLGSDAYNAAEKHAIQVLASDREWRDLSISTDYRLPNLM